MSSLRLHQLAQDGASGGQVLTYNSADSRWEPASPSGGGGGGGWTQVFSESGSSFGNFTPSAGTWASNGTEITQTAAGTARAAWHLPVLTPSCIFEADIEIVSGSGSDQRAGLIIGYDGTNSGGILGRLHINGSTADAIQIESDSSSARFSVSTNWGGYGAFHHVRLISGNGAGIYVDGTLIGCASNNVDGSSNSSYVGLFTGDTSVKFKNIQCWIPALP